MERELSRGVDQRVLKKRIDEHIIAIELMEKASGRWEGVGRG